MDSSVPKNISDSLQATNIRILRLERMHRFLFTSFKELVRASYNCLLVKGFNIVPRIGMLIAGQPEEPALYC